MNTAVRPLATSRFRALGTTAELVVTEPGALATAREVLRRELCAVDQACSRFREDSEITVLLREQAGRTVEVSPLLAEALRVALRAAEVTDGLVDPTVGHAVRALGYDRDFDEIERDSPVPTAAGTAAPGWWRIAMDHPGRRVMVPRGVLLDLGATAKALAADRACAAAAQATGCGVLVGLGGDVAVAGIAPSAGWQLVIGDDHADTDIRRDPVVAIHDGGLATSGTTCRAWRRAGRPVHHIVDPRTGDVPAPVWRTVSVAAADCVTANTASTAAVVLGGSAPGWLTRHSLPARLVAVDGEVVTVAGWPVHADQGGPGRLPQDAP